MTAEGKGRSTDKGKATRKGEGEGGGKGMYGGNGKDTDTVVSQARCRRHRRFGQNAE